MLSRICVNLYTKTPRPSLSWHNLIVCLTSNHNWWNLGWDAFKVPLASVFFKRPWQPPCRLADIEQQRGKGMWRDLLGAIEFLPLAPAAGFSCQLGEELKLNTIKGKRNQSCLWGGKSLIWRKCCRKCFLFLELLSLSSLTVVWVYFLFPSRNCMNRLFCTLTHRLADIPP